MPVGGNCLITQKPPRDWRNSAMSRETGFTLLDPEVVRVTNLDKTQEVDHGMKRTMDKKLIHGDWNLHLSLRSRWP